MEDKLIGGFSECEYAKKKKKNHYIDTKLEEKNVISAFVFRRQIA